MSKLENHKERKKNNDKEYFEKRLTSKEVMEMRSKILDNNANEYYYDDDDEDENTNINYMDFVIHNKNYYHDRYSEMIKEKRRMQLKNRIATFIMISIIVVMSLIIITQHRIINDKPEYNILEEQSYDNEMIDLQNRLVLRC